MYILARKSDQTIIEVIGPVLKEPSNSEIISMGVAKYGNDTNDYTVFRIADGDQNQKRISAGEKFDLVWNDDNSGIIDIDFAIEESFLVLRCLPIGSSGDTTDTLVADGIDYIDITTSIWLSDLSVIDTTFNQTLQIPIYNPQKKLTYARVTFVDGISVKRFRTTEYGIWNIPLGYKFEEANVKISSEQVLDINALMPI